MGVSAKDIYKAMDDADHHARAVLRIHTEIRAMLAQVQFPKTVDWPCRHCGANLDGERALAFHVQNVHDGPPVPLTEAELAAP